MPQNVLSEHKQTQQGYKIKKIRYETKVIVMLEWKYERIINQATTNGLAQSTVRLAPSAIETISIGLLCSILGV